MSCHFVGGIVIDFYQENAVKKLVRFFSRHQYINSGMLVAVEFIRFYQRV